MTVRALDALDELDRRIVVAMQHDGRASWRAIAEMVDSSTATVARRGQNLLASGVARVAVVPALGSSGQVDSFLIRINCQPGTQLDVTRAPRRPPGHPWPAAGAGWHRRRHS